MGVGGGVRREVSARERLNPDNASPCLRSAERPSTCEQVEGSSISRTTQNANTVMRYLVSRASEKISLNISISTLALRIYEDSNA